MIEGIGIIKACVGGVPVRRWLHKWLCPVCRRVRRELKAYN